jgi:PHD/YefM family antitoxin component YafN of YafNO toxin-antitoxin module
MVHLQPGDVHSLTDFQRNTKVHLERLRASGRPEILTVNGRAEIVLLAPATYTRLSELAHEAETLRGLRDALAEADRGELTPLEAFDRRFRRDHGLPS